MSSSNYTTNLSLSQFASLDKPSWIQDYNSDMSKIDGACHTFTGTDGTSAGTAGFVPAPATTDADKFLKSDGTWATAGGGSSVTLYDDTGTNTDGAMTQKCVTDLLFKNNTKSKVQIGSSANANGTSSVAIGDSAKGTGYYAIGIGKSANADSYDSVCIGTSSSAGQNSIAIGSSASCSSSQESVALGQQAQVASGKTGGSALGKGAKCNYPYSVALGSYSTPRAQGVVDVTALEGSTNRGYQGTNDVTRTKYRVIAGVHDGEDEHDAMTVGQVKTLAYKLVTVDPSQANTPADFIGQIAIYYEEPQTGIKQLRGRFMCTVIDISQPQQPVYIWSTMN